MPIRFRCPKCSQKLSISRRKAGLEVSCPSCGGRLRVPLEDQRGPARDDAARIAGDDGGTPVPPPSRGPVTAVAWQRRPVDWDEEMDLTPMVDVTFLLLIFFMVTASYSIHKTIEVPRPDPEQQGVQQQPQDLSELENSNIIVHVASDNTIRVDEDTTPVFELVDVIRSRRLESGKTELIVNAAGDSFHETVVAVVDAANLAGVERIRIAQPAAEAEAADGVGGL
jgi:biopolymer transport protein ExbD